MIPKWKQVLQSRKFWAAFVALLLAVLRTLVPDFPIDDEALSKAILTLIAYIIGTGLEDGLTRFGTGS